MTSTIKQKLEETLAVYEARASRIPVPSGIITDYPSLKETCLFEDGRWALHKLKCFVELLSEETSLSDMQAIFQIISRDRHNFLSNTALSLFAAPDSEANACWNQFYEVLYEQSITNDDKHEQKIEQDISINSRTKLLKYLKVFIKELHVVSVDFKVKEKNQKPSGDNIAVNFSEETLTDTNFEAEDLSQLLVIDNKILAIPEVIFWREESKSMISPKQQLRLLKQIHANLAENYPEFYKNLTNRNPRINSICKLLGTHITLREAILRLQRSLKLGGTKHTGRQDASEQAIVEFGMFLEYLNLFNEEKRTQLLQMKRQENYNPYNTLDSIIQDHFLRHEGCVETGADYLEEILINPANQLLLEESPCLTEHQVIEKIESLFDADTQISLLGRDNCTELPLIYIEKIIRNIQINTLENLVIFLRNFDASFYPMFLPNKIDLNGLLNHWDNYAYVLMQLDNSQIKAFAEAYQDRLTSTFLFFINVLSSLSSAQCAVVLDSCRIQLPRIINTVEDIKYIFGIFDRDPLQRMAIFNIFKEILTQKIRTKKDFVEIFSILAPGEYPMLFEACRELLPTTSEALKEFIQLFTEEKSVSFLNQIELGNIIKTYDDLWQFLSDFAIFDHDIHICHHRYLSVEKQIFISKACFSKIILTSSDFNRLVEGIVHPKLLQAIMDDCLFDMPKMLNAAQDFANLFLVNFSDKQRSDILNVCKNRLGTTLNTVNDLMVVLPVFYDEEYRDFFDCCQKQFKEIIQTETDLEIVLTGLSEQRRARVREILKCLIDSSNNSNYSPRLFSNRPIEADHSRNNEEEKKWSLSS
jgi:hypothetical protein